MKSSAEQIPMCSTCKWGKIMPVINEVLCPFYGVVASDFSCKNYSYNLFLIKSKRKRNINPDDFTHDDFSIDN